MSRRWVEGVGGCFDDKILHLLAWNLPVNIFGLDIKSLTSPEPTSYERLRGSVSRSVRKVMSTMVSSMVNSMVSYTQAMVSQTEAVVSYTMDSVVGTVDWVVPVVAGLAVAVALLVVDVSVPVCGLGLAVISVIAVVSSKPVNVHCGGAVRGVDLQGNTK